ncbi:MAG: hypothetical protein SFU27_07305 [Thermonemataceae bacterium]|nr:hypothetical protein [Thermonemataceae bacterium]
MSKKILLSLSFVFVVSMVLAQNKEKCFSNDGLKYKVTIKIEFLSTYQVKGTLTRDDYAGEILSTDFKGTIKGNILGINFNEEPFSIGDGSEWRNDAWKIVKKNNGKENLEITFTSKNYKTNKWDKRIYNFETCE